MLNKPVVMGGSPLSKRTFPFVRPMLPKLENVERQYQEIFGNGMVTTGPYAEKLGEEVAQYVGTRYAVAVSSCTTGLLLSIQALNLPQGSEVILPSFTFMASAIGPVWNNLRLRFVDVDLATMNIDPNLVEAAITPQTSAIIAVHQFGNPAAIEELQAIAKKHNLALLFDAAHGFGSLHNGYKLGGNGNVEIFSMSPTKLLIAGEGGIVATNDEEIATHVKLGRNYGNPGNYDCLFPGLNARMSELHAILALQSLQMLEAAATHRNLAVSWYKEYLQELPGISFQSINDKDRSSYKDLSIRIDERQFGIDQKTLKDALEAEGIHTRVYYSPVVHQMPAFIPHANEIKESDLPNTIDLQTRSLSLPMYSNISKEDVEIISATITRLHHHAEEINQISSCC